MSGTRKLLGTHQFLSQMVCNKCGFKVSRDSMGRSVMRDHLSICQPDLVKQADRA